MSGNQLTHVASVDNWCSLSESERATLLCCDKPLMIKGMVKHWPLVESGKLSFAQLAEHLLRFDSGMAFDAMIAAPQEQGRLFYRETMDRFNFELMKGYLPDALKILHGLQARDNPAAFYIGSKSISEYLPGLEKECTIEVLPEKVQPNIWIGNSVNVATHNDKLDNVACVAVGRRRFTLFPPEQEENLYITHRQDTPGGRPISVVDIKRPDFSQYPKFRKAIEVAQVANLDAGDALYMPKYWWHNVESINDVNILVNFWWQGATPTLNK